MILKLRAEKRGKHIHETFFVAKEENRTFQNIGTLIMEMGEWQMVGVALLLGADKMNKHLKIIEEGWSPEKEE